jgi:hypothetical protein
MTGPIGLYGIVFAPGSKPRSPEGGVQNEVHARWHSSAQAPHDSRHFHLGILVYPEQDMADSDSIEAGEVARGSVAGKIPRRDRTVKAVP